jgi:glycosyltransferase involved in cell wall biosynthesis
VTDRILVVTPARNEAHQIRATIDSVLQQSLRPWRYYLVSDGSSDGTDEIMEEYAEKYAFIRYLRREKPGEESNRVEQVAPGKVGAIENALLEVEKESWGYLAVLDADVVLPDNFYKRLLEEFLRDRKLGIAGCFLRSVLPDGNVAPGGFFNSDSVGGPVQVFRRACYENIGRYKSYGHEDCVAVIQAREKGWKVRSFADLVGDHHVPFEGYSPKIKYKVPALYKLGKMDFVMFVPFWFVLIQSGARMFSRPLVVAGMARLGGYLSAVIIRPDRFPPQKSWIGRQKMYLDTILGKLKRILR